MVEGGVNAADRSEPLHGIKAEPAAHEPDLLFEPHLVGAEGFAENGDLARRVDKVQDPFEQGALARAVAADQPRDVPFGDVEGNGVEAKVRVTLSQPAHGERVHVSSFPSLTRFTAFQNVSA